jgi:RNA-directed DNA polymerase
MMHGHEKSDLAVVAVKPANKAEQSAAELVEQRAGTKGDALGQSTHWTQRQGRVAHAPECMRQLLLCRSDPRWRESRTYGSVRGARGNSRPYRETVDLESA